MSEFYVCSHCGFSPKNRANWCDLGCGSDYNKMTKLTDAVHVHVCACGQIATTRFMTGQQWYDKLMKEFLKVNHIYETPEQDDWVAKFTDFVEAAKKAANL